MIISEHRGRKGRRGGLEFKVQKIKRSSRAQTPIGKAFWEPEEKLSQERLTAYWARQKQSQEETPDLCKVRPNKEPASALVDQGVKNPEQDVCALEGNDCRKMPDDTSSERVQYTTTKREYAKDFDPLTVNYGNWRLEREQKALKVWKCEDCSAKLQVEEVETITIIETPVTSVSPIVKTRRACQRATVKQETVTVVTVVVSMEGTSSETRNLHAWQDKRHLYSKQRRKKEGNPILPSVAANLNQLLQ